MSRFLACSPGRAGALILSFSLALTSLAGAGSAASDADRPAPKVTENLQPAVFKTDDLEARAFAAINQERAAYGLPPLRLAGDLSVVAREHSQDMVERDYFAHQSPDGRDLRHRFARHGISNWRYIAENIACNRGYEDPVNAAVAGWMNSPGHRKNILNKNLAESGIGVAVSDSGRVFFTQVFATRDGK
jgi:uncharacterized protein YkwD